MNGATFYSIAKTTGLLHRDIAKLLGISDSVFRRYKRKREIPDYIADEVVRIGQCFAKDLPQFIVKIGDKVQFYGDETGVTRSRENLKTTLVQSAYLQAGKFLAVEYEDASTYYV